METLTDNVVLDSRHADIVTRYSFGKDVVSPIEALRGNDSLRRKAPNIGEDNSSKLIMLSPLDFGLANGMLTEYMAFGSAGISKLPAKASSQPKAEWTEIPVPIASFYSNYSPVSQGSLGDFNYTTEEKISSNTGKYACAVTALFAIAGNIVYNNHFLINCTDWYNQTPDWDEYSKIWNATGTTETQDSKANSNSAVQLGETQDVNIGPGFVAYCKTKNFILTERHWTNPNFQQYINQVSGAKHSVFTARIKNPSGNIVGHSMAVAGYCTAKNINDTSKTSYYLYVYDGWDGMAFLDFNYSGWLSTFGTFF